MGKYIRPVPDGAGFRLIRPFGDTSVGFWYNGKWITPEHTGEDYGNGQLGFPILAQHDGTISYIGWLGDKTAEFPQGMGGYCVRVEFGNGYRQAACHMIDRSSPVSVGDKVSVGQQIGRLGATGNVVGGHLHNELLKDGVPIDPTSFLNQGSLPIAEEADDVEIKGTWIRHVHNRFGKITSDANLRAGVLTGDNDPIVVLPAGTPFYPNFIVGGNAYGTAPDRTEWYAGTARISSRLGYRFGYIHSSLLPRTPDRAGVQLDPVEMIEKEVIKEVPTGITQQQVLDAAAAGRKDGIADAAENAAKTQ